MIRKPQFAILAGIFWIVSSCTGNKSVPRFEDFPKIDAHVHIQTSNPEIMKFAKTENFRFITLCVMSDSREYIDRQLQFAKAQREQFPQALAYTTTFSMEGFEDPGWLEEVINKLAEDFEEGAMGVKVWKDIGMTFRDSLGNFIMIDDRRLDPIFNFIEEEEKIVVGHLGEPKNCWLPIDSMTVNGDKAYYGGHPQYHMYNLPDYPSYEEQIAARDRMLEKHPNLTFIGAHLGSLEWSVDELAKRLDKYPHFAVDMAARVCHFQVQDSKKVRDFIVKYQDRIIYATDFSISDEDNYLEVVNEIKEEWRSDWKYFSTNDALSNSKVNNKYTGLGLDVEVLEKIYYKNVFHWFPGVFE